MPIAVTLPVTENASREENDVDQTLVATLNSVLGGNRLNTLRVNFTQEDVAFANPNFNGNGQDQAALMPQLNLPDVRRSAERRRSGARQQRVPDRRHDVVVHQRARGQPRSEVRRAVRVRRRAVDGAGQRRTAPSRSGPISRSTRAIRAPIPSGCRFACPDALNRYQKAHFVAAFAQDKWHVSNRTTVSLGLRYDLEVQPISEVDNPAFPGSGEVSRSTRTTSLRESA